MSTLVDVLAVLVRKSFGEVHLRSSWTGTTVRLQDLYDLEEARVRDETPTEGGWTSRMNPEGLLVVTDGTRTFTEVL